MFALAAELPLCITEPLPRGLQLVLLLVEIIHLLLEQMKSLGKHGRSPGTFGRPAPYNAGWRCLTCGHGTMLLSESENSKQYWSEPSPAHDFMRGQGSALAQTRRPWLQTLEDHGLLLRYIRTRIRRYTRQTTETHYGGLKLQGMRYRTTDMDMGK